MFYFLMRHILGGPLTKLYFRPWARGVENVPEEGAAILASNHLAVIDSFVMPLVLDRRVKFLGKSDYFTGKGLKGRLVAGFMKGVGTIPVDRAGGRAEGALKAAMEVLDEGGLFGIYPEGTRSPDGRLYKARVGVARLAIVSGAPVIPVVMVDTDKAQKIGQVLPKPIPIGVIFGEPLDFSRYAGMENDRYALRAVADAITLATIKLTDQEFVDEYASDAKARMKAERDAERAAANH